MTGQKFIQANAAASHGRARWQITEINARISPQCAAQLIRPVCFAPLSSPVGPSKDVQAIVGYFLTIEAKCGCQPCCKPRSPAYTGQARKFGRKLTVDFQARRRGRLSASHPWPDCLGKASGQVTGADIAPRGHAQRGERERTPCPA